MRVVGHSNTQLLHQKRANEAVPGLGPTAPACAFGAAVLAPARVPHPHSTAQSVRKASHRLCFGFGFVLVSLDTRQNCLKNGQFSLICVSASNHPEGDGSRDGSCDGNHSIVGWMSHRPPHGTFGPGR